MINYKKSVFQTLIVLIAAIVITLGWFKVVGHASNWALFHGYANYYLMVSHLAGMLFLLVLVAPYHFWVAQIGVGNIWQRSSLLPTLAVVVVYFAEYSYSKLTGAGQEKYVQELLSKPPEQILALFLTILILAPVSEEIVFRGVLLNIFRSSRIWTLWVGVVIIALLFTYIHNQYQNISTFIEIFAISIIFAWARIRSGGLMLPILLHSMASMLAVIFTWLG